MVLAAPEKVVVTAERRRSRAHAITLGLIIVLSIVLYAWNIGSEGFGDPFYAATVKSMSHGFTNFVFGSFDPLGLDTVDKPPMALWIQAGFTAVFGFHGWVLLLPQVIEGALAVFLLHRTVRAWLGENAGLLAAFVLALTPITVAVNRDNATDTLLVLWCVAAVYAFTRSIKDDQSAGKATRWLLLAAFFVGCGFLTKFLAAWIIVPSLAVGYLIGRRTSWGRRLIDLLAAAGVLLVSSLWWIALTSWWPGSKPYIGSSANNSTWDLAFGYNGFSRILGEAAASGASYGSHGGPPPSAAILKVISLGKAIGTTFAGNTPGTGRLFSGPVAPQIGWLLPCCGLVLIIAVVAGVLALRRKAQLDRFVTAGWVVWGSWLLVMAVLFTYEQGTFHAYYTTEMGPGVAALSAAGLVLLWRRRHEAGGAWLLLPFGVAVTAVWAWFVVSDDPGYNGWLRYAVVVLAVIAIVGLVIDRFRPSMPRRAVQAVAVCGVAAALLAPAVWSVGTAFSSGSNSITNGYIPSAGPIEASFAGGSTLPASLKQFLRTGQLPGGSFINTATLAPKQQKILDYVTAHAGGAEVALAVEGGALRSAQYSLSTNLTVIGMGGFKGDDPAPTAAQLAGLQKSHQLAFVLSVPVKDGAAPGGFGSAPGALQRRQWVQSNCTVVAPTAYGEAVEPPTPSAELAAQIGLGEQTLYSCMR